MGEHLQMNLRIFVSGETDEPHLTLPFGVEQGLSRPARRKVPIGIVEIDHFVNLPEIEIVCLQATERFVELLQRHPLIASVRTDLRHEKDLLPPALQGLPHQLFGASAVVLPGIVQKGHACINRFLQDANRLGVVFDSAPMGAAETERGDLHAGFPQQSLRDVPGCGRACRLQRIGQSASAAQRDNRSKQAKRLQQLPTIERSCPVISIKTS